MIIINHFLFLCCKYELHGRSRTIDEENANKNEKTIATDEIKRNVDDF